MNAWSNCSKILCIRPDNMGDVLMSAPAIAALKQSFGCSITVMTSSSGQAIANCLPSVDDVLVWNAPWVKGTSSTTLRDFDDIVQTIRERRFDGAVIFTVFSQNPLPSALIATLAGIPKRVAYCRENPYQLLSHWVPEKEPYHLLRHQVQRDLDLVREIGAQTTDDAITLKLPTAAVERSMREKIASTSFDITRPWLILHPGVSEPKRALDAGLWIEAGRKIVGELDHQVIVTGIEGERALAETICHGIGDRSFSLAGQLTLYELTALIRATSLLISVNTGTVHLAAALQTKVIVLYALTNPQHPPWKAVGRVLPFSIDAEHQSRNEVLRYLHERYFKAWHVRVTCDDILAAACELLVEKKEPCVGSLVLPSYPCPGNAESPELPRAVKRPEE